MSIIILGGGTFSHVTPHLSICAKAYGTTAKWFKAEFDRLGVDSTLVLTKMADTSSNLETNDDVHLFIVEQLKNPKLKAIIFNVAMCDFVGDVPGYSPSVRLSSNERYLMDLYPYSLKVIDLIKQQRPDVYVVGFKTTAGEDRTVQILKARKQLTTSKSDLVLANDIKTHKNILVMERFSSEAPREALLGVIADEVVKACYPSKPFNLTHHKGYLEQIENSTSIQV